MPNGTEHMESILKAQPSCRPHSLRKPMPWKAQKVPQLPRSMLTSFEAPGPPHLPEPAAAGSQLAKAPSHMQQKKPLGEKKYIHTYIHTYMAQAVSGSRWHSLIEDHLVRHPLAPRVHCHPLLAHRHSIPPGQASSASNLELHLPRSRGALWQPAGLAIVFLFGIQVEFNLWPTTFGTTCTTALPVIPTR